MLPMSTGLPSIPESCSQCPHIDLFHSSCTHPLRQNIIHRFEIDHGICPIYSEIRAEAMLDLENRIE